MNKTTPPLIWLLLSLFSHFTFGQHKSELYHEAPDDDYMPVDNANRRTSPAYLFTAPQFFTTQVNVDENGNNIVGDAANEPTIAVDPTNPERMVIGWRQFDTIASNFRQAGFGFTLDGGQTWTFPGVIDPGVFRSDPVLDVDADGTFYYNSLTIDTDYSCNVFRSTGDGTWDNGPFAYGGDKQWMVIDKTSGPGEGHIYSNWNGGFSVCPPGSFTRSTDGGDTYEPCVIVNPDVYWGTLSVGPEGELYTIGDAGLIGKSTNAKLAGETVTWQPLQADLGGNLVGFSSSSPNPGGLVGQAWIATDHSGGANHGHVYALASVKPFGVPDPLDVHFTKSTDGGLTWSAPIRLNDDGVNGNWQWFGTLSVAPNGRLDAIWLDTRDNPDTLFSALYYTYSVDGGLTWSPNEKLSETFDPYVGWPQQNKLGDYFHMVSDNEGAHLAWAATFNGEQDVFYGHISQVASTTGHVEAQGFQLSQNFPNPFGQSTTIPFSLDEQAHVSLRIMHRTGQVVATLAEGNFSPGHHAIQWNGKDTNGHALPAGMYFYELELDGRLPLSRKMILLQR